MELGLLVQLECCQGSSTSNFAVWLLTMLPRSVVKAAASIINTVLNVQLSIDEEMYMQLQADMYQAAYISMGKPLS